MRTVWWVSGFVVAILTLAFTALPYWQSTRPEATVFYHLKTQSLPTGGDPKIQNLTEVTLWNSSTRAPARNLNVAVSLVLIEGLVKVGHIETQEPETGYDWTITQPYKALERAGKKPGPHEREGSDYGTARVEVISKRLAPQDHMTIPIWWQSSWSYASAAVKGVADQGVLVPGEYEPPRPFEWWRLWFWFWGLYCFVFFPILLWYKGGMKENAEAWLRRRLSQKNDAQG